MTEKVIDHDLSKHTTMKIMMVKGKKVILTYINPRLNI